MAQLRVVAGDEAPPPRAPQTVTEALAGSERDVWFAMRQALAKKIDEGIVAPNAIRSTFQELRELDRLIRAYDAAASEAAAVGGQHLDETFDASAI